MLLLEEYNDLLKSLKWLSFPEKSIVRLV
jgi:hypothetical protein